MLENFRLRVFREVARHASFRRAAEVLYISQPAVTQQIKALEQETGHRLLDRTAGRVRLTAAGEVLLQYAERSEAVLQEAVEAMGAIGGELRGSLRVAASTTIAQYILPKLLASFGAEHPRVALHLESANTEAVVQRVSDGTAQLGLTEGPAHRPDLMIDAWLRDELLLVVPAGHPWVGRELAPAALLDAPLLIREQGSGTRAILEAALDEAGVPVASLRIAMELGSTEALLACVEAGLGVGFASRFALRRQRRLGTLRIVKVTGLRVLRDLSVVRQRGPQTGGVAEAFHRHLLHYAQLRASRSASRRAASDLR